MNINALLIAFFVILVIFAVMAWWIIKTEKRLKKLFIGKKAENLEEAIVAIGATTRMLKERTGVQNAVIENLNNRLKKSIQGVNLIRFNPFKDAGSNQSFAIAMLNEEGDGLVMSTLYSRERMSLFAKPIKNMSSEFELTNEEKEAINNARVS